MKNAATDDIELTKSITLRTPISLGDKTWETLDLHEPTLGDLERCAKATGSPVAGDMELLACVTTIPLPALRKIGVSEYREALIFLKGFMEDSPETGGS